MAWKTKKSANVPRRRQVQQEGRENDVKKMTRSRSLFRRNRTLTGSSSAIIGSANEHGGDLRSPRAQAHHLAAHRRRLVSLFVVVTVTTMSLAWLVYEFTARTYPIASSAVMSLDRERYQKVLDDYFAAHPIERLRILIDHDALNAHMHRYAPEVKFVTPDGSAGFAMSRFVLTLREPLAGWSIGSARHYVDDSGIVFDKNYFEEPSVKIVDNSGVPQQGGAAAVSGRFLNFVGRTVVIGREYDMTVIEAVIPEATTRQIDIKIEGREYPVKLSLDRPVGEQLEDARRAIGYFDSKGVKPEYIDVRVSGKAYYRG